MRSPIPRAIALSALLLGQAPAASIAGAPPFCKAVDDVIDPETYTGCPADTRLYYYIAISSWMCCQRSPFSSADEPAGDQAETAAEQPTLPPVQGEPDPEDH